MQINLKKYFIPVLLVFIFFLPGVAALAVYQNPKLITAAKTNQGELLTPPTPMNIQPNEDKWQLIFWNPKSCTSHCIKQIDKLARLRLALGRRLYDVQVVFVSSQTRLGLTPGQMKQFKEYDIQVAQPSQKQISTFTRLSEKPRVFIEDPKGFLVLAYSTDANPKQIHHDLKRLLNVKE